MQFFSQERESEKLSDNSVDLTYHPFYELDGYKIKMTGKNCPNYTIKEEMAVMQKLEKTHLQLSNPS